MVGCGQSSRVRGTAWWRPSAELPTRCRRRCRHSERWPPNRGPRAPTLRVRMAVHTGEVQVRGDDNYVGQTLNRCARLRGIGHGGQVLVSAAAAAVLADRLPDGVTLRDLGVHRLRDLGRPEHVWQLVHPDVPAEFGALRSLEAYRHNLPVQLTPLVGRVGEITELRVQISEERLVTLVGSAGVGKTRLASGGVSGSAGPVSGRRVVGGAGGAVRSGRRRRRRAGCARGASGGRLAAARSAGGRARRRPEPGRPGQL